MHGCVRRASCTAASRDARLQGQGRLGWRRPLFAARYTLRAEAAGTHTAHALLEEGIITPRIGMVLPPTPRHTTASRHQCKGRVHRRGAVLQQFAAVRARSEARQSLK